VYPASSLRQQDERQSLRLLLSVVVGRVAVVLGSLRGVVAAVLAVSLLVLPGQAAPPVAWAQAPVPWPAAPSVADVAEAVRPSVVLLKVPFDRGAGIEYVTGSGVRVQEGILTNAHVVAGAVQVEVEVGGGAKQLASVVQRDEAADLALLVVYTPPSDGLPPLLVAPAQATRQGETVLALGFPRSSVLGSVPTLTTGILSAIRQDNQGVVYVQTDAAINPGNSGGALVNLKGELIGLTTFNLRESEGLGFAVAGETIREFLNGRLLPAPAPIPTRAPLPRPTATLRPAPTAAPTPVVPVTQLMLTTTQLRNLYALTYPRVLSAPIYVETSTEMLGSRGECLQFLATSVSGPLVGQVLCRLSSPGEATDRLASVLAGARASNWMEIPVAGPPGRVGLRHSEGPYLVLDLAFTKGNILAQVTVAGSPGHATAPDAEYLSRLADVLYRTLP
jgi:putative serine protease PepD